jgi:hypothetical protein
MLGPLLGLFGPLLVLFFSQPPQLLLIVLPPLLALDPLAALLFALLAQLFEHTVEAAFGFGFVGEVLARETEDEILDLRVAFKDPRQLPENDFFDLLNVHQDFTSTKRL